MSTVSPWEEYGQVLVTPGFQSSVGRATIVVRYPSGDPLLCPDVIIDISDCENLCVDPFEPFLSGTADGWGTLVLNPQVGGCADCPISVRANGVTIAAFDGIRSTDWDGAQANGRVDGADFAFFATAFKQTQDTCADYNGDGGVSGTDFTLFAISFSAGDANPFGCD
jgi:hypothetical protein